MEKLQCHFADFYESVHLLSIPSFVWSVTANLSAVMARSLAEVFDAIMIRRRVLREATNGD